MQNPWNDITFDVYEKHMSDASVMQLQHLNAFMKRQLEKKAEIVMILGVAGGNGLEHISSYATKVYGVDVNAEYLSICKQRYAYLKERLQLLCLDLRTEVDKLPHADLMIADLLIEYIGYTCFEHIVSTVCPTNVFCVIQINPQTSFVSQTPYLHAFDQLEDIHIQVEEDRLLQIMEKLHYRLAGREECILDDGKALVCLEYCK